MDYHRLYDALHEPKAIVDGLMDEMITKGSEELYMKYVMAKLPSFQGELYSGISDYIIDEVSLTYDRGDNQRDLNKFWMADEEPDSLNFNYDKMHEIFIAW